MAGIGKPAPQLAPDHQALLEDLNAPPFSAGVDRGYWRQIKVDWPNVIVAIAAPARPGAPGEYGFRFECSGYPMNPAGRLWDHDQDQPLPVTRWPQGGPRLTAAFNPGWHPEGIPDGIYVPMDREATKGHPDWAQLGPSIRWNTEGDLTQYLHLLRDLLHDPGYVGLRG